MRVEFKLVMATGGRVYHELYVNEELVVRQIEPEVSEAIERFLNKKILNSMISFVYDLPEAKKETEPMRRAWEQNPVDACMYSRLP